jgi:prepilin-type processing-associated H-X9-DG protein
VVELLVVIGVITLLAGLTLPALGRAKRQSRATACAANLHQVGELLHAFANDHDDYVAPTVRDKDYSWDRGEQRGWDIETGRYLDVPGGPRSVWRCAGSGIAYVGNARALGLDNRAAWPDFGLLHRVGLRQWYEPGRLVLAYDLQPNLLEDKSFAHARDPMAADLSDENLMPWGRGSRPFVEFHLDRYGPHDDGFGVLFADGHARVGKFGTSAEALLWSGPRWWTTRPLPSGVASTPRLD